MIEVHHERRAGVAILTLDRPVANALAPSLRAALSLTLDAAIADDEVQAIVLHSAGSDFSTGVDVAEYDTPPQAPWINDLCLKIENSPKPVVAALHGAALGGGFELALAAHMRVASEGARVALPDIKLGLVPGGGATQRIPRMAGAQVALELMLSGQMLDVADPRLKRIIDKIVPGPSVEAAVAAALELAAAGKWARARDRFAGLSDPLTYQKSVAEVMGKLRQKDSAEADIVRCVEAAQLLPYERGLEMERVTFEDRRNAPVARARRHILTAERRAMIMPERSTGQARDVTEVLIPGSSALVIELAVACLDAGLRVTLMAEDVAATDTVRSRIGGIYDGAVSREVMTAEIRDNVMSRLAAAWPDEALARTDLVLDTGEVDLRAHGASLNPAAVWAPVTSGGPMPVTVPNDIGGRQVDLRVYRPALSTKLVELCVPPGATADAAVTVAQFFSRMGHTVIRCECVEGLVGGNMSAALYSAALVLAGAGASPYRIDAGARALGFARGPFQLMDIDGLPTVVERLNARAVGGGIVDLGLLTDRIAQGAGGRAAGKGFYLYDEKGAHPDMGLPAKSGEVGEWFEPQLGAALQAVLVNEAARLLSAPVVQRASDIDVVMVGAFGFDRGRGGPLFQAELQGLFGVMKDMQRCAGLSTALWHPHQMIGDLVKNGEGFFGRHG
ncbi:enoyl-CoA hydratase/isomerase family protein [uncultured Roseovarius sp.]|uniref:enoyl-CoA hydratase/isomerase family protein n=1 Tax=uncultured Roseovarius sp. TaxID=293344 RepID=UPI00260DFF22|nr:enoyl-CoA hydratase/isomerase family protein [uncultured Roseovarius sp.]